jgi:hypothetical protein
MKKLGGLAKFNAVNAARRVADVRERGAPGNNQQKKSDSSDERGETDCTGKEGGLIRPMSDDEKFLEQFETTALPLEEWHHKQHIKVAYLYLRRFPFEAAMVRMREGVKAFNAAKKIPESLTRGYHETMTQAWMRLVYFTLCEYGPGADADTFYEQNPQLSQTKTLRFFYTKEVLQTAEAKAGFVGPDVVPLPQSKKTIPRENIL